MSYYVLPDYWVAGYAEGDAVEISATATPSLAVSVFLNGVVNVSSTSNLSASGSAAVVRSTPVSLVEASTSSVVSADAISVLSAASTAAAALSPSVTGAATFAGQAQVSPALDTASQMFRVRRSGANIENSCIMAIDARFIWLDLSDTDETWTDVVTAGEIWTDQSNTAEVWERV